MAGAVSEAVAGAGLLVRGARLIGRSPRLFLLGAVPPLLTSVIFTGVLVVLITRVDRIGIAVTPFADSWGQTPGVEWLRWFAGVLVVAGSVLVMVVSFTALTLAVGAPLYDQLSAAIEAGFGEVPENPESAARGLARAAWQSAALILVSALGAVVLFALGFIPAVGQTVVPVLSATFGGYLLVVELVGSAFERRGLIKLGDRVTALRSRRWRTFGLALPTFLLLSVPFAGAVVFPIATAAGTLLARELLDEPN